MDKIFHKNQQCIWHSRQHNCHRMARRWRRPRRHIDPCSGMRKKEHEAAFRCEGISKFPQNGRLSTQVFTRLSEQTVPLRDLCKQSSEFVWNDENTHTPSMK